MEKSKTPPPFNSESNTLNHIKRVNELLIEASIEILNRAIVHDASKLKEPEKSEFDRLTPILAGLTYGSPEYAESLRELNGALMNHYKNNSHHPQHHDRYHCRLCNQKRPPWETWVSSVTKEKTRFCLPCSNGQSIYEAAFNDGDFMPGIMKMNLFDVIEMFFDWKAATERTDDGEILKSIEINENRFHLGPQLSAIFRNTVDSCGWKKVNQ